jgi:WhiB family redox-sensing transcriptional regulator
MTRTPARGEITAVTPCAAADPELWFAKQPAKLNLAKSLCARCPLKGLFDLDRAT